MTLLLVLLLGALGAVVEREQLLKDAQRNLLPCLEETCIGMKLEIGGVERMEMNKPDGIEPGFYSLLMDAMIEHRHEGRPMAARMTMGGDKTVIVFPHPDWISVPFVPEEAAKVLQTFGIALALGYMESIQSTEYHTLGGNPYLYLLESLVDDTARAYLTLSENYYIRTYRPIPPLLSAHNVDSVETLLTLLNNLVSSSAYSKIRDAYRTACSFTFHRVFAPRNGFYFSLPVYHTTMEDAVDANGAAMQLVEEMGPRDRDLLWRAVFLSPTARDTPSKQLQIRIDSRSDVIRLVYVDKIELVLPEWDAAKMRSHVYIWSLSRIYNRRFTEPLPPLQHAWRERAIHLHVTAEESFPDKLRLVTDEQAMQVEHMTVSAYPRRPMLDTNLLARFPKLQHLVLAHNSLSSLTLPDRVSIATLDLDDNLFGACQNLHRSLNAFALSNLKELHFRHNGASPIECSIFIRQIISIFLGTVRVLKSNIRSVRWDDIVDEVKKQKPFILSTQDREPPPLQSRYMDRLTAMALGPADDMEIAFLAENRLVSMTSHQREDYVLDHAIATNKPQAVAALVRPLMRAIQQEKVILTRHSSRLATVYLSPDASPMTIQLQNGPPQLLLLEPRVIRPRAAAMPSSTTIVAPCIEDRIIETDADTLAALPGPRVPLFNTTKVNENVVCHVAGCGTCDTWRVFVDQNDQIGSAIRCLVISGNYFRYNPKNRYAVGVNMAGQGQSYHLAVSLQWMAQLSLLMWERLDEDVALRLNTGDRERAVFPSPRSIGRHPDFRSTLGVTRTPQNNEVESACLIAGTLAIALNHALATDWSRLPYLFPIDLPSLTALVQVPDFSRRAVRASHMTHYLLSLSITPENDGLFFPLDKPDQLGQFPLLDHPLLSILNGSAPPEQRHAMTLDYVEQVMRLIYSNDNTVYRESAGCFRRVFLPHLHRNMGQLYFTLDAISQQGVLSYEELLPHIQFRGFLGAHALQIRQMLLDSFLQPDDIRPRFLQLVACTAEWRPSDDNDKIIIQYLPLLGGLPEVTACLNTLTVRNSNPDVFLQNMRTTLATFDQYHD